MPYLFPSIIFKSLTSTGSFLHDKFLSDKAHILDSEFCYCRLLLNKHDQMRMIKIFGI